MKTFTLTTNDADSPKVVRESFPLLDNAVQQFKYLRANRPGWIIILTDCSGRVLETTEKKRK